MIRQDESYTQSLVGAYFRPEVVRRRLERLRALGRIDSLPTISHLLVAGRDQMMIGAAEKTKASIEAKGSRGSSTTSAALFRDPRR